MTVFVDSSAFVARLHANDSLHARAVPIWKALRSFEVIGL
jgi:predicted nucleic acid-binding protein